MSLLCVVHQNHELFVGKKVHGMFSISRKNQVEKSMFSISRKNQVKNRPCILRRKFGWPMPSLIPGIKCVVCYSYICCCLPCSLSTTTTPRSSTTTPPPCRCSWYAVVLVWMSESSNSLSGLSEALARHFRVHLRYC